jgi:hypothetical protein
MKGKKLNPEERLAMRWGQWWKLQFIHLSFTLPFFPADENLEAFNEWKLHLSEEASKVTDCFQNNYEYGRIWRHFSSGVAAQSIASSPPNLWSVRTQRMHFHVPKTTQKHRKWEHLVGSVHVSVHWITEEFSKEQHRMENKCETIL